MRPINHIHLPLLVSAICLALFASCTNEIPFKAKDATPQLIISSLMNANENENKIWLSLSGIERTTPITDGEIKLFVNGKLKETILPPTELTEPRNKNEYRCHVKFSPGDHIRMEASAGNGKYSASAETTVPVPVKIDRVDTLLIQNRISMTHMLMRIKSTFTDDPATKNYYRILIDLHYDWYGIHEETGKDTLMTYVAPTYIINQEDVVLTEGSPQSIKDDSDITFTKYDNVYNIFDDSRLNGPYTMTTYTYLDWNYYSLPYSSSYSSSYFPLKVERESLYLKVRLLSLCEATYRYLRVLNTYDSDDYDDVLSPPVIFPSNVKNGIGIFGISSETVTTITLYKDRKTDQS